MAKPSDKLRIFKKTILLQCLPKKKELEAIQIPRPPLAPQGNNFSLRNAVISASKE